MSEPDFTPEQIEAGRILFARPVSFMLSVVKMASLPPPDRPEVCFAGRSNVGKSSLINALTPCRTRAFATGIFANRQSTRSQGK